MSLMKVMERFEAKLTAPVDLSQWVDNIKKVGESIENLPFFEVDHFEFIEWLIKQIRKAIEEILKDIETAALNGGMELMLELMALACHLTEFKKNIKREGYTFEAVYNFTTATEDLNVWARFVDGKMTVSDKPIESFNARVEFNDARTFLRFIFSPNHDILQVLLDNSARIEGNLNYVFKFGFMAYDLLWFLRLGDPAHPRRTGIPKVAAAAG